MSVKFEALGEPVDAEKAKESNKAL